MTECNRRLALAVAGGFAVTAVLGRIGLRTSPASHADEGPAPGTYRYGDQPSQFAELRLPAGSGSAPVVVIIHGGFWLTGFGASLGRPLAADLVSRGFAALNVEYRRVGRGSDGGGGWPHTGDDVAAAVDALATEGQRLAGGRLDLGRVAGLGHSAGGQLAGWLAARRAVAVPVTGVVSQAGVLDLVTAADQGLGGDAVQGFMGGTPAELPAAYADASPIARVPLGVPSVCVHGRGDDIVPIEQSERFVAAARAAGDRSELRAFDGSHFQPITVGTQVWTLCVDALKGMLAA